jgi:hypothetical protein
LTTQVFEVGAYWNDVAARRIHIMIGPYCPGGKTAVNTNISAQPKLIDAAPKKEARDGEETLQERERASRT